MTVLSTRMGWWRSLQPRYSVGAMMSSRMPFTFNTMVLLPLLRSLPASGAVSVVLVLISLTGLDVGLLRLGHPETAADLLVALMMSFSAATPVLWGAYIITNAWTWLSGVRGVGRTRTRHTREVTSGAPDVSPPTESPS
jgi:ABC-type dipeptide/oligopeptide/nickel transport system permease component